MRPQKHQREMDLGLREQIPELAEQGRDRKKEGSGKAKRLSARKMAPDSGILEISVSSNICLKNSTTRLVRYVSHLGPLPVPDSRPCITRTGRAVCETARWEDRGFSQRIYYETVKKWAAFQSFRARGSRFAGR